MQVFKGGDQYSFCPGKATWDFRMGEVYRLLVIASETGVMLKSGGLLDQPSWFVETLGWFIPSYSSARFQSRVQMVMGDGKVEVAKKGP